MKNVIAFFAVALGLSHYAFAASTTYSCFTDGYEPGTTIEVLLDGNMFDITTYNLMPDGSKANVNHYGSNAKTIQKLQDGKTSVTGWNFAVTPAPEVTVIFAGDFKSGTFIFSADKLLVPNVASVTCAIK